MEDFKTMAQANDSVIDFNTMVKKMMDTANKATTMLAYCDYIAHLIQGILKVEDTNEENLLASVGRSQWDLDANGSLASTKKTIAVEDRYGKKYKITVEEA
jgi:hypothetical protein